MAFSLKALWDLFFGRKENPKKNINGSTATKNNISASAQDTPKTCTENSKKNMMGAGRQMNRKIKFTLTADMTVGEFKKQIEEQLGCIATIYCYGKRSDDDLLGSFASFLKGGKAAEIYADSCKNRLEFYRRLRVEHPDWSTHESEEALLKQYQESMDKIVEQIVWEFDDTSAIHTFMEAHFEHIKRVGPTLSLESLRYRDNVTHRAKLDIYLWKKDEPHCFHPNDTFVVVRKLCGKA